MRQHRRESSQHNPTKGFREHHELLNLYPHDATPQPVCPSSPQNLHMYKVSHHSTTSQNKHTGRIYVPSSSTTRKSLWQIEVKRRQGDSSQKKKKKNSGGPRKERILSIHQITSNQVRSNQSLIAPLCISNSISGRH